MSINEGKPLDDLFKGALEHQELEPELTWLALEENIDAQKKKKRKAIVFWITRVAAVLIVMIGAMLWLNKTPTTDTEMAISPNLKNEIKSQLQSTQSHETPEKETVTEIKTKTPILANLNPESSRKSSKDLNSSKNHQKSELLVSKKSDDLPEPKEEILLAKTELVKPEKLVEKQVNPPSQPEIIAASKVSPAPTKEVFEILTIEIRPTKTNPEIKNHSLANRFNQLVAKAKSFDKDSAMRELRMTVNNGIVAMVK